MFTRHSTDGKIAILIVYVDDIILTGNDITEMERLKQCLASEFEIKDLGSLKFFLGMEIARSRKGIAVSQRKYVLDLLKETGMSGCRPVETPIDLNQKLGDNKGDPVNTSRQVRRSERYNWAATRGVNEEMLLENLPEDLQREIRRHLFKFVKKNLALHPSWGLASLAHLLMTHLSGSCKVYAPPVLFPDLGLNILSHVHQELPVPTLDLEAQINVRIFALLDEPILDAICERLRQRTYIMGSKTLYRGGLIDKMVFIVRGKMESVGEDGNIVPLLEGDVCGEELLTWSLEHSSVNKDGKKLRIPGPRLLSNRMVRCLTNVEAFILRASDLGEVTSLFSRFLRNSRVQGAIRYESPYWRGLAASHIQVAWRYRKKRLSRANTSNS
ncbi:hypothetical protein RJ639_023484 [Escallonia herrerae]|uniref:Cyclic nucleotide-binding domain-containing protein n=1 Tax=Escallonia herrerae TaxID=1293975 RepID=A0AA88V229_9ASTE|nr:hypothetical protein RJ639_023484 [Escallonia herrerae]